MEQNPTYEINTPGYVKVALDMNKPLYIADTERNKIFRFWPDCIKLFKDNISVHGKREVEKFKLGCDYSLKYLNKRIIFTRKIDAQNWLAGRTPAKDGKASHK